MGVAKAVVEATTQPLLASKEKAVSAMVMQALESGQIEECNSLYPFLGKETLHKLADELVKKYGFKGIKGLAPFL